MSSQLRKLSDLYDVPILITNQVTAFIPPNDTLSLSSTPEQEVIPALGLIWSNCVSTRFILQRKDAMVPAVSGENKCRDQNNPKNTTKKNWIRVRIARVLQSVNMPKDREVRFVIDTGEVVVA